MGVRKINLAQLQGLVQDLILEGLFFDFKYKILLRQGFPSLSLGTGGLGKGIFFVYKKY